MAKIIIYDGKNFLIGNLNKKVENKNNEYIAHFCKDKVIQSNLLKQQLKKIEKTFKYHKETNYEKSIGK